MTRSDRQIDRNKFDIKLYTPEQAKSVLAKRLRELAANAGPGPRLIRLEVPMETLDLLKWLAVQEAETKFYFSGRDAEDIEVAGVGEADAIDDTLVQDCASVFLHIRTRLAWLQEDEGPSSSDPRYFGGFAFARNHIDDDWASFGSCRFFIPRFELRKKQGYSLLACHVVIPDNNPVDSAVNEAVNQLEQLKFDGFPDFPAPGMPLSRTDVPGHDEWVENLEREILEIKNNRYMKTVLARKAVFTFAEDPDPVAVLSFLKMLPSRRYDFLFRFDGETAFVGSSPERLYKRSGRRIDSEAVAGTRSRGKQTRDDEQLAKELLDSDKEKREHDFVADALEEQLQPLCASLDVEHTKGLLKLKEGQHLISHLSGVLKDETTDEILVDILHPTPAVGGTPLNEALAAIERSESFKRGWYAGALGTVGRYVSDFSVALRCGLFRRNRMSLFSGVGVVNGSIPEDEWNEVESKIVNFLDIVYNGNQ